MAVKAFTLDITPERAQELSDQLQHVVDIDLEHPHIARPIATGVVDSVAYLAQQYVAGESLDAAIRQYGPAPAADAARLIGHVAEALDVAALMGVFHGALHPRDILVTPGETHLTGLGISMALERIGQHGPIRRPYAAPERESGQEWGAPADVFSLAVIAYEVLTGRRALPGTEQPLPGLTDIQVKDPAGLREILETSIDPDPGRRPATALEFAGALASALVDVGAARASGERGSGSRRKIKPRAPKLPGLDESLVAEDGEAAAPPTSVDEHESAPAHEAPDAGHSELVASVSPSDALAVNFDGPPMAEVIAPVVITRSGHDRVVDWDAVEAESDDLLDDAVPLELDPNAPGPERSLDAGPFDVPELRMRPTPQPLEIGPIVGSTPASVSPAAIDSVAHSAAVPSPPASEPARSEPAPPSFDGRELFADVARDAEPLGLDLTVPRALDPTRDAEGLQHSSRRFGLGQEDRGDRSYGPIIVTAVVCLLLGLLGGYELGARWGQPTQATAVATQPAAAGASVAISQPPVAAPVEPTTRKPAATVAASPVREQPATPPSLASTAPASAPVRSPATESPAATTQGARAAAKAAPAVTEGRINVRSVPPRAEVSLDGGRIGTAPRALRKLPLGSHIIKVTLPGYVAQERKVSLTAARPTIRVDFTLHKAAAGKQPTATAAREPASASALSSSIAFDSRPPGARVLVDGKVVGLTPFTLGKVDAGRHSIELRLSGYRPWATSITVAAGKPQRLAASLERDTSR